MLEGVAILILAGRSGDDFKGKDVLTCCQCLG